MNYKSANLLSGIFFAAALVSAGCLYLFGEVTALFILTAVFSFLLVVCGFTVKLLFWRCPECRGLLPLRTITIPHFCPNCGSAL